MRLNAALCGLLALTLAACAGLNRSSDDSAPIEAIGDEADLAALLERDQPKDTPREIPEVQPSALIGAKVAKVSSWLGKPSMVWREGAHALWQYRGTECVILLFVDSRDTVRDVRLGRRDGPGSQNCNNAIGQQIALRAAS